MPRMLAGFRVQSELGRGGMGVVYACWDESLQRRVAVKVLAAELAADEDLRSRFLREARAAAKLSHPHIATVYAVHANADEPPAIVMELVEGDDLRRKLRAGPLELDETLRIATGVASAIAKAHTAGIVHRDLKPENILIGEDGVVKLLDFGIAKALDRGPDLGTAAGLTATGQVIGTAGYMAPEQIDGLEIDPRADVFAFGVIVFEMLTGRLPYDGNSAAQRMAAVLRDPPADLLTLAPETPEAVASWVRQCIERDRERRPADGSELSSALAVFTGRPRSARVTREPASAPASSAEPIPLVAGKTPAPSAPTPTPAAAAKPSAVDFEAKTELSASSDVARVPTSAPQQASIARTSSSGGGSTRIAAALIVVAAIGGGTMLVLQRDEAEAPTASSAAAPSSLAPAPSAPTAPSIRPPAPSASAPVAPPSDRDEALDRTLPWQIETPKPAAIPTTFECSGIEGAPSTGCSDGVIAWCDQKERRVACCAPGLVPHDTDGACGCPPGGSSTARVSGGCEAKPFHTGMPAESIQAAVRARFGEIRDCYGKALESAPDRYGKVTLSILISPNGRLFSVRVAESTLPLPSAQKCMLEVIRKLEFPPPRSAHGITVTYPIELSPG